MNPHRYVVKIRGRDCAAFVFARDAEQYVKSDVARKHFNSGDARGIIPLYSVEDYTIEEAKSGLRVVGTNGHGRAILESIKRAEA